MSWCSTTDGICYVLALVVVAVLVYLGCSELRKAPPPPPAAARRATTTTTVAARAAKAADPPPPRRELKGSSPLAPIDEVFAPLDVDRSMTRVVGEDTYKVPDSVWVQEFIDGDKSTFRPVDKEAALKSANTRPAQHMKNGRADGAPPSRVIGLSPMEFARKTVHRSASTSASCVSFLDTDARHMSTDDNETDCLATGTCPWQQAA